MVESTGGQKKNVQAQSRKGRTLIPARAASMELDIRGMMTDEASCIVDRFLDDAVLGHLTQVTIIHG